MDNHNGSGQPARAELLDIVLDSADEVLSMSNGSVESAEITESTPLIGQGAILDSMGLVTLIVEIEQRLEEDHGVMVVLADDRAMSQKNSPFRSVGALTDYLQELVAEEA